MTNPYQSPRAVHQEKQYKRRRRWTFDIPVVWTQTFLALAGLVYLLHAVLVFVLAPIAVWYVGVVTAIIGVLACRQVVVLQREKQSK